MKEYAPSFTLITTGRQALKTLILTTYALFSFALIFFAQPAQAINCHYLFSYPGALSRPNLFETLLRHQRELKKTETNPQEEKAVIDKISTFVKHTSTMGIFELNSIVHSKTLNKTQRKLILNSIVRLEELAQTINTIDNHRFLNRNEYLREIQFLIQKIFSHIHNGRVTFESGRLSPDQALPHSPFALLKKSHSLSQYIWNKIQTTNHPDISTFKDISELNPYLESLREELTYIGSALKEQKIKFEREIKELNTLIDGFENQLKYSLEGMNDNQIKRLEAQMGKDDLALAMTNAEIENRLYGVSTAYRSMLAELWVMLRTPLLNQVYYFNVTPKEFLSPQLAARLPERMQDKELDIFSQSSLLGSPISYLGEVKYFLAPLNMDNTRWIDLVGAPKKKKRGQIPKMHDLMHRLAEPSYEVHLFLINGVTESTKWELEQRNVIVHGPVFPDRISH
ncbi:MAG: hypothetical protein CL677_02210 [Bdellovibrionaceae bacterium]|nr:hypothetical protein [Pseudobdellovibrionaceae bacterium]|tara:strand:- start:78103 stop:79464 length:1362 start_codon:yes stop_codon:yes gene_type:complete